MKNFRKTEKKKSSVSYITISEEYANQRIDNFLIRTMKGMPKSHVYRILRKGEVRINKKRVSAFYKLLAGDVVRLPPFYSVEAADHVPPSQQTMNLLQQRILYEDANLLVINKPSGMSVHAGSTVRVGVIEAARHLFPKLKHLELAHRLDSETSGCLVLAKKRSILRELHSLLREGQMTKLYLALTQGKWLASELKVDLPLHKDYRDGGKHVVEVNKAGKSALTEFKILEKFDHSMLVEVKLFTGRTHQIRVHAAHRKHPIALDDRYGDPEFNKIMHQMGLKRMFLHARLIDFVLPSSGQQIRVEAPLDVELEKVLQKLRTK